jgi:Domain of unknown function (DUF4386)
MSPKATGRTVGGLFLAAFVCYGVGSLLVDSLASHDDALARVGDHHVQLATGALLMLLNSAIVALIGVLSHHIIGAHHRLTSMIYLVARVFEATVLAVGVVFVMMLSPLADEARDQSAHTLATVLSAGNDVAFQVAMIGLGVASVLFCRALLTGGWVPRLLAWWGIVGYAVFATGALLELFGLAVGVWLAIPGGLFEVALGVRLLRHGFVGPAATGTHQSA